MSSTSFNRLWILVFGVWLILLSGVPEQLMGEQMGSPGAIQALRLRRFLGARQEQVRELEVDLTRLEEEKLKLEKSSAVQEREIRRVLGYAAADEIIFDFASPAR